MNSYEEKVEAKRERYLERSQKAESDSNSAFNASRKIVDGIPMGQPILIGHHSEKRHRRDLERSDNAMRKACDLSDKADYYKSKAAGVGTGGISSDDPEAVVKLKEKVANLEKKRDFQKSVNAAYRVYKKKGDSSKLHALDINDEQIAKMEERMPSYESKPFPAYSLTNIGATIRNSKKRIEQLMKENAARSSDGEDVEEMVGDIRIVENVEENRYQMFFPDKPEKEIRQYLGRSGFRWSRRFGCWQRQLNDNSRYAGKRVLKYLEENKCA